MSKRRRKSRTNNAPASVMTANRAQSPARHKTSDDPARFQQAVPLTDRAEPLVVAQIPPETTQDELQPLPRSQSLAVQNYGFFARVAPWFRRLFYKPPSARQRKEVDLTRKQLKDLRRQISVMERTLGQMS